MAEFWENAVYFGATLTFLTYGIAVAVKGKFKHALLNPILISMLLCIVFLKTFQIEYDVYYDGAKYINYLLTPATVCLAIPLHNQFQLLKKNRTAVLAGIASGVITSLCVILGLSVLMRVGHGAYVSMLPKSITTAIGMDVSQQLGGDVPVTVAVILITGILGNAIAETVFRMFGITHPIARGVALGTASHAVGTAKALELGEVEGAMSSLSIVVAGILTVFAAPLFSMLY